MSSEPLSIEDSSLAISINIENAPKGLIVREAVQNAIEAPAHLDETMRKVFFNAVEVEDGNETPLPGKKLAIGNTCQGLNAEELRRMTNLSATFNKDHSNRTNRGEGLKVSALRYNPEGVRIRSRRDGEINEVFLYRDGLVYSRYLVEDPDNSARKIAVYEPRLTAEDELRYQTNYQDADFVEVTFYGESAEQNTATDLYNRGKGGVGEVGFELFARFWKLPEHATLPVKIIFSKDFRSSGHQAFYTMNELMEGRSTTWKKDFRNHTVVTLENGVKIRYVESIDGGGSDGPDPKTPYRTRTFGRGTRIAIEYRGEMYDVSEGGTWSKRAISFGLHGVASTVSVIIHLPDTMPIGDDRYRLDLDLKGERISVADYAALVQANRPKWLRELQEKIFSHDGKDVQQEIQEFLDRMPTFASHKTSDGSVPRRQRDTSNQTEDKQEKTKGDEERKPPVRAKVRNEDKKGESRMKAPEPMWASPSSLPNLKDRGAVYDAVPNKLFLNSEYPVLASLVALVKSVTDGFDSTNPEMASFIEARTRDYVAYRVGRGVAVNIYRRGLAGWDTASADAALSSESLTTLFDNLEDAAKDVYKARIFRKGPWLELLAANDPKATENKRAANG